MCQEASEEEIRALTEVADEGDAGEGECRELSNMYKLGEECRCHLRRLSKSASYRQVFVVRMFLTTEAVQQSASSACHQPGACPICSHVPLHAHGAQHLDCQVLGYVLL